MKNVLSFTILFAENRAADITNTFFYYRNAYSEKRKCKISNYTFLNIQSYFTFQFRFYFY